MYTLIFRKGDFELEFKTTNKEVVQKQLALVVSQASIPNQKQLESKHDIQPSVLVDEAEAETEIVNEHIDTTNDEIQNLNDDDNVKPAEFYHLTDEEKKLVMENAPEIIPQTLEIGSVKPLTINSLQNPEPVSEVIDVLFDDILNKEIDNDDETSTPVLKDEKYVEFVEGKAALEKLDFLILTAKYIAQFESKHTFSLKHINAKLMQNFTMIVDHSVLQNAILREFITKIREGAEEGTTEYMLTEKGQRSY